MSIAPRRLGFADMARAALVHRAAYNERLPWLAGRHTPAEDKWFYENRVYQTCEVWGVEQGGLAGLIAFRAGWIDQLYVLPERQGHGVGDLLLDVAKAANPELQLWTFIRNSGARRFYERRAFVALEETDGRENEENEPAVRYRWRHAG